MNLRTLLARAKRNLLKKPFMKDPQFPPYWLDKVLGDSEAVIVQIGSNDGKTGDPLFQLLQKNKNWKALFVEPVPYAFEQLKKNYAGSPRFQFENVAINNGEQLTFYWVDPSAKEALPDLPYWYDQLGSFDKQHILKHFDRALEPFLRSAQLEGISLKTLFDRNKIAKIDLLHIDTEGYDWKILSQLNLEAQQAKFILYEYHHLSEEALKASFQFLDEQYVLFNLGIDILAVSRRLGEELISEMSRKMKRTEFQTKLQP